MTMTAAETFADVRTKLIAAGANLPGRKAQDIAFQLYDLAEGKNLLDVQQVLTLSLTRLTFASADIEGLLSRIEESSLSTTG